MPETLGPIKVLVMDRVGYGTFKQMLRLGDYDVSAVKTAQEAWVELTRNCPDLLLLDLSLVTSDDMLFLRQVRSNPALALLNIAVLSSDCFDGPAMAKSQADLKELRVELWFKPVWTEDFLEMISGLFSKH